MKRILIVPANTDLNRGDQALTWSTIDIVKQAFGSDCQIFLYRTSGAVQEVEQINSQTSKLGYPMFERLLRHPRRNESIANVNIGIFQKVKWGYRAIVDLLTKGLLLINSKIVNKLAKSILSKDDLVTLDMFKSLDLVIIKGGGFLHSYGSIVDPYVMFFQLFDVYLAHQYRIPVVMMPNSIGPLNNRLAKRIVVKGLQKCNHVFVREGVSENFVNSLAITCLKSPDLGFYLKESDIDFDSYLNKKGIPIGQSKTVAITLRPYRFDSGSNAELLYEKYMSNLEKAITILVENEKYNVTLLAHTIGPSAHEDDRIALLEIKRRLKHLKGLNYLDDSSLNCREVEKIYQYFDLVIGTRFHSVIFALNVGTPAIAISYGGNKAVGIMKDIGIDEYVLPIENPDFKILISLVRRLEENRGIYLKKLQEYKDGLEIERSKLVEAVKNF